MKILVNGREAVLKANASFEYVSENPLFTEAEDYTISSHPHSGPLLFAFHPMT